MPPIAFFDVDNTLLDGYSGYYTTRLLIRKNILKKRRIAQALFYKMITPFYQSDPKTMYRIATRDMVGSHSDDILRIGRECFEKDIKPRLFVDALKLVQVHQKKGHPVYLITSGPTMTVQILSEYLKADGHYSAGPVIDAQGFLTRELRMPLYYREGKVVAAQEILSKHKVNWKDCYYYADSTDDLFLFEKVGHPVLVNPSRKLRDIGRIKKWNILHFKNILGKQE